MDKVANHQDTKLGFERLWRTDWSQGQAQDVHVECSVPAIPQPLTALSSSRLVPDTATIPQGMVGVFPVQFERSANRILAWSGGVGS